MPLRRISNDYCTPIALIHESSPNKQHSSSRFFASTSVASIFPFEWRSFFSEKLISQEIAVEDREATDSAIRSLKKCKYQNLLKVLAGNLKIQPMDAWRDGNVINENEK